MDRSFRPVTTRPQPRRNDRWLKAYAASRNQRRRLRWRDALVRANLPLVRQVAARMAPRTSLPFDDLAQVGCLGLIRAIEAFDPGRGVRFSSFAVPYIRGAIAHELRDRGSLLRIPRPLWELRQRAVSLEQRLRGERGAGPDRRELAQRLGCAPTQLAEALALGQVAEPRSLDAPLNATEADGQGSCLLDLLPAPPAPSGTAAGEERQEERGGESPLAQAKRRWLRQQLAGLSPELRRLITGRLLQGCTWVELGRELGIQPRLAQRRHDTTLQRLQEAARAWMPLGESAF
ncbi:MAG: sigma-70 family RNA polymerase sigma factor [Cyanobacteriota bacterium]|nr:sigma-70 family RNA polymerase sigma factor [Cyanobacteriota bacterium]